MTSAPPQADLDVAPGSIVVVRDEEWLVTSAEQGSDGWLLRVRGLSELVADTTATFYSSLDDIEVQDPAAAEIVADGSSGYRDSRLWLEALLRKTPFPYGDQTLTVSTQAGGVSDYEREARYDANGRQLPTKLASELRKDPSLGRGNITVDGTYTAPFTGVNRDKNILLAHQNFLDLTIAG